MLHNKNSLARTSGLVYLITVITGIFSLMYVPKKLMVKGDLSQTINNIQESSFLFNMGIVSEVLCYAAFLILLLYLYQLFKDTNQNQAILMVTFVVVAVPLSFVAVSHKVDVSVLINSIDPTPSELSIMQVKMALQSYKSTLRMAMVFWGLWLFPFGYLVYQSGLLPKVLGIFLMLGSIGYLVNFLGISLYSGYTETIVPRIAKIPSSIGEIGTCLWLLIVGFGKKEND